MKTAAAMIYYVQMHKKTGIGMPRPEKKRRICPLSGERRFGTDGNAPALEIRADELEALRLCDLEEVSQQEAATRMGVSRGTLQRLLYSAHRQIAFALVCGHPIWIEPPTRSPSAGKGTCRKKCRFCRGNQKITKIGGNNMIIAVTSSNGEVFQHFGHTPEFTIYETKEDELLGPRVIPTGENGHGALAGILDALGVEVLICGGIGGGAQMALDEIGVKVVGGASGKVADVVAAFLKGELEVNPDFQCHHHDHDSGHKCGEHGCGEHKCGGGHSCH